VPRSSPAEALPSPENGLLPPRADAAGTLRKVLEAAMELFSERGYHAVTVREIAKAVGIHVSSIYGHIPSKEMLLYQLQLIGHEEHWDQVRSAVAAAGPGVVDRVAAYLRAHVRVHMTYRMLARVSNKELYALTGDRRRRIQQIREHSRQLLVDLVEQGCREGVFPPQDPWLLAVMLGNMGVRVCEWWSPDLGYPAEQVEDLYVDASLRSLGIADPDLRREEAPA
jgi:AcrR family transcriptional regulator